SKGLNTPLCAEPFAVETVIAPLLASNGTVATIDVAVCAPRPAAPELPVHCTVEEPPKPVPPSVTADPPFPANTDNNVSRGPTLNELRVLVVPPALVTAIGPSTAP